MKFYVCDDIDGTTFDCFMKKKEAIECVRNAGGGSVTVVDVPVNADSIKKLLGNHGGYACSVEAIYECSVEE